MHQAIASLSHHRVAWVSLAASALGLEITALYFQHVKALDPCVLCVYERVAVLGILLAGLIGAIAPRRATVRWLGFAFWATSAAWGLSLALEHTGIQFSEGLNLNCTFFAEFPDWARLDVWWPSVFAPTGSCDEIQWLFLGLSIPQWLLVVFGTYQAIFALVVASQFAASFQGTA